MTTTIDNLDNEEFNKPNLPTLLNVLTILTFIGSSIQILFAIWGFFTSKSSYDKKDMVLEQMNTPKMPGFVKYMIGSPEEFLLNITKNYENRIPILLVTLVAAGLCIWGASQMRGLKKQGFLIYSAGKIIGLMISIIFVGFFMIKSFSLIFFAIIAILFIGLYAAYRRHLIY